MRGRSVEVQASDGSAVLLVSDDGKGFSDEETESRRAEGHFGLSLLADLAASARGKLDAESAPGRGTQIRLEVPAQ